MPVFPPRLPPVRWGILAMCVLALTGPPSNATGSAAAEPAPAALSAQSEDALGREIATVRTLIDRQLSPAQRLVHEQVVFVENQSASVLPYARKIGDRREIAYSAGAHGLFAQIVIGAMLEQALGLTGSTARYASYVARHLNGTASGDARDAPPQGYAAYMKIPRDQVARVFDAQGIGRLRELMFVNLAFVVAHETGHHVLGHFESVGRAQKELEDEADAFAAVVGAKAGLNPLLARPPFYFQTALVEAEPRQIGNYSSAECRIARFSAVGGHAALEVPRFVDNLERAGQTQQFRRSVSDAERYLKARC